MRARILRQVFTAYPCMRVCTHTALGTVFRPQSTFSNDVFNAYLRIPRGCAHTSPELAIYTLCFHIHVNSQLKANFSFKKMYRVNNLALTSYNKRFLYTVVGAPGITHDERMLKESSTFDEVLKSGRVLPD